MKWRDVRRGLGVIAFFIAAYLWAAIKIAVAVAVCLIYPPPPLWVVLLIYFGFRIERALRMVGERIIEENERSMRNDREGTQQ